MRDGEESQQHLERIERKIDFIGDLIISVIALGVAVIVLVCLSKYLLDRVADFVGRGLPMAFLFVGAATLIALAFAKFLMVRFHRK
jgi:hypothetical protein